MLFYCSIASIETGKFVAAAYVNAEDAKAAADAAGALVDKKLHPRIEVATAAVPPGGPAIPAIGKLLTWGDLEAAGLAPRRVLSDEFSSMMSRSWARRLLGAS